MACLQTKVEKPVFNSLRIIYTALAKGYFNLCLANAWLTTRITVITLQVVKLQGGFAWHMDDGPCTSFSLSV
jgi:hypothetical protein